MSIYGKLIQETELGCRRHVTDILGHEVLEITGYTTETGMYNALVKVKGIDDYLRGRSEMVLLSKDRKSIFMELKKSGTYKLPGGGWNENEDYMTCAIRETAEEAHYKCSSVKSVGQYIDFYNNPKGTYQKNIPEQFQWIGVYTEVFCGLQDGMYTKRVNDADQDDISWKGMFFEIDKVKHLLLPIHKKAIEIQLEDL